MYIEERYIYKNITEVDKYQTIRKYTRGESRTSFGKTSFAQAKINDRRAKKRRRRLIQENFGRGDIFVTLTYKKDLRPISDDELKADRKNFLDKLRRSLKKLGRKLKYFACTEIGERGGMHHHFLIGAIDTKLIQECWVKGGAHIEYIYSENISRLAAYLSGDSDGGRKKAKSVYESFTHSRGMKEPVIHKKILTHKLWRKEPRCRADEVIVDLRSGVTDWGQAWQSYKIIKLERGEGCSCASIYQKR